MKKILLLLIAALTMTMASAKDIKTVVLTTVPQMHCENCEKRIKENIRFEKGVKKIVTDVEHQTVTITYEASRKSSTRPARSRTASRFPPTRKRPAPTCEMLATLAV